jgi:hypothetical protein
VKLPQGDTVWLTYGRLHAAPAGRNLVAAGLRMPALSTVDLRGRTGMPVWSALSGRLCEGLLPTVEVVPHRTARGLRP